MPDTNNKTHFNFPKLTKAVVHRKRVLVRIDGNVPLKAGKVLDDTRIQRALPLLNWLKAQEAKIIVISHFGRPDPKKPAATQTEFSLAPIAKHLEKILHSPVQFIPEIIGDSVKKQIDQLEFGSFCMLENVRFAPGETANSPAFAKALANLTDVYINEAFSTCHRSHASVTGITTFVPSFAGPAVEAEVHALSQLLHEPKRPFVLVIGGAKITDKAAAITNLLELADVVLVGGGVANVFLQAEGYPIGKSYVQEAKIVTHPASKNMAPATEELLARTMHQRALKDGYIPMPKIIYPVDVVAATDRDNPHVSTITLTNPTDENLAKIVEKLAFFDIGPKTAKLFAEVVAQAGTVFWNGPLGLTEVAPFSRGTQQVAEAIANSKAFSVLGGGDTLGFAQSSGLLQKFDYVSAAGGAALDFLAGSELPGLAALTQGNKP